MRRIGVIGTCHVTGIGDALFQMLDGPEMAVFEIVEVERANSQALAAKTLAACDVVFSHYLPDRFGPLSTASLRRTAKHLAMVPSLIFTGFHPDCVYFQQGEVLYKTPLDDYNSAIAAASYSLGLPVERAARLFNKFVFQKLGYFEEFAKARAFLDQIMTAAGLDLSAVWDDWMRGGAFMHTLNHPKPHVLASVAKLVAIKAGLLPEDTRTPEMPGDSLAWQSIWPVYPEIAEALGIEGSYVFKKAGRPNSARGEHNLLSLRGFIEGSYEKYAGIPAEAFEVEAIARVRAVLSTLLT